MPTFTAASASLNLSGLEELDFSPIMDGHILDGPEWYHNPSEAGHAQLSPPHEHFNGDYGPGFASHAIAVSHEAIHRR